MSNTSLNTRYVHKKLTRQIIKQKNRSNIENCCYYLCSIEHNEKNQMLMFKKISSLYNIETKNEI